MSRLFLSSALLLLGASACRAQPPVPTPSTGTSDASPAGQTLRDLQYDAPNGYARVSALSDDTLAIFGEGDGVFLGMIPSPLLRDAFIRQTLERVLLAAARGESQDFRCQPQSRNPQASRFEVGRMRVQCFNGQSRIVAQVRVLAHEGREILTGYYYRPERGAEEAAAAFRSNQIGDSVPLGSASARLIQSIVGEAPSDAHSPPAPPPSAPPPPRGN